MSVSISLEVDNTEVLAGMVSTFFVTVTNDSSTESVFVDNIALNSNAKGYIMGVWALEKVQLMPSEERIFSIGAIMPQVPYPYFEDDSITTNIDVNALVTTSDADGVEANAFTNDVNMTITPALWPQRNPRNPSVFQAGSLDASSNLNSGLFVAVL